MINKLFLKSCLTTENTIHSTESVLAWIEERNKQVNVELNQIALESLNSWHFTHEKSSFAHTSGNFFSIDGIQIETNWGQIPKWSQPIINQAEIGYLGFITKKFNDVLYFLVQAKIEPGNVNYVQLSPTLQATKSNYTQVHGGKAPKFLEYFKNPAKKILLDQLQSEQGARFLKKRNRNIIIEVMDSSIQENEDFKWLTLGQIKQLAQLDNKVNMDTRTVISGISYGDENTSYLESVELLVSDGKKRSSLNLLKSELSKDCSLHTPEQIISWFTEQKTLYDLAINKISLQTLKDWSYKDGVIKHKDGNYFEVIGMDVTISNREVSRWQQPLIKPVQEGICAFIIRKINNVYHFLVQAKVECGNFDIVEMAPTVQCITGSYKNEKSLQTLPFLKYVLTIDSDQVLFDSLQSEEGGRFYREQNRNLLVLGDDIPIQEIPSNFCWLTLSQLKNFIKYNNYLNIQARSLLSIIDFS